MAIQMPNNWAQPINTIPRDVLADDSWTDQQRQLLITDRVDAPAEYRRWLVDASASIDIWQTTYFQELTGQDPVWEWTSGALLRPVLAGLSDDDRIRFTDEVKMRYRSAYRPDHTNTVLLPFSRLFLIATHR